MGCRYSMIMIHIADSLRNPQLQCEPEVASSYMYCLAILESVSFDFNVLLYDYFDSMTISRKL